MTKARFWTAPAILGILSAACTTVLVEVDPTSPGGQGGTGGTTPAECPEGAVEQAPCSIFSTKTRTCTDGDWSPYSACDPPYLTIPVPGRDMVHDPARNLLYVTTDGAVEAYNLATQAAEPPLLTGGDFLGIDLAPDGNTVAIADGIYDAKENRIRLVDLPTHTPKTVTFPLTWGEAGTFMPLFTSDTPPAHPSRVAARGYGATLAGA